MATIKGQSFELPEGGGGAEDDIQEARSSEWVIRTEIVGGEVWRLLEAA
jgi:hypothetical protein